MAKVTIEVSDAFASLAERYKHSKTVQLRILSDAFAQSEDVRKAVGNWYQRQAEPEKATVAGQPDLSRRY